MYLVKVKNVYQTREELQKMFPLDLKNMLIEWSNKKLKGCLIFDDLMEEVSALIHFILYMHITGRSMGQDNCAQEFQWEVSPLKHLILGR